MWACIFSQLTFGKHHRPLPTAILHLSYSFLDLCDIEPLFWASRSVSTHIQAYLRDATDLHIESHAFHHQNVSSTLSALGLALRNCRKLRRVHVMTRLRAEELSPLRFVFLAQLIRSNQSSIRSVSAYLCCSPQVLQEIFRCPLLETIDDFHYENKRSILPTTLVDSLCQTLPRLRQVDLHVSQTESKEASVPAHRMESMLLEISGKRISLCELSCWLCRMGSLHANPPFLHTRQRHVIQCHANRLVANA